MIMATGHLPPARGAILACWVPRVSAACPEYLALGGAHDAPAALSRYTDQSPAQGKC